jgi:TonB-dependent starch-binding outer membrane protein SusC
MRLQSRSLPYLASYCTLAALLLLSPAILAQEAFAQTGVISGTVVDQGTGLPIPGANVSIVGTTIGAATNMDGEYRIPNAPSGEQQLQAAFIGFRTQRMSVNVAAGQTVVFNFELQEGVVGLDEVVVTGTAGDTRRRAIGNAVSRVDAAELMERSSRTNVSELLQSQTPGLTLIPGSGTAGTSSNIRLRGAGSLTARNQPVIYIDGVRINSGSLGNFDVFGQSTSGLDIIAPDDIESIEVIKGPAASTLYGAEAAAGVIQIITKRGRMGDRALRWNLRSEIGSTTWAESLRPTNYSVCTQARVNDAQLWPGCQGVAPGEIISVVPLSDNPNALRDGLMHRQTLAVSGGGEQYAFYVSGNFSNEEGVYHNNFSEQGGVRANFQVFPMESLDFTANVSYTRSNIGLPLGDNTADGIIISSWLALPGRAYPNPGTQGYFTISPENFNTYDNQTRTDRVILGGTVNYRPTSWFDTRLRIGYDLSDGNAEVYFAPDNPFASRTSFGLVNDNGLIARAVPSARALTVDYTGNVTHRFSQRVLSNTSFGMQYVTSSFARTTAYGQDLGSGAVRSLSAAAVTTSTEAFTEQKSLGFYLQEQIALDDRFFLTGAVRMDNNSAFGTEIRSVFYPKLSASWVISEESFFNVRTFDNLRLRAAWGQAGNSPGPFDAIQTYGTLATTLRDGSSVSALSYATFGNPDLKPERGSEIEFGVDASFLDARLEMEATYYNTRTTDALISVPIAPSSGFSGFQLQNLGTISNSGFEFLIRGTPLATRNFSIHNTLTITTNRNELVSFGDGRDPVLFGVYAPVHRFQEGYPLAGFWSRRVQRDAQGNVVRNQAGTPLLEAEHVYRGPSVPTREIGFSTTLGLFRYFEIFALADYKGGHYQFNVKDWRRDRSGVSWETVNPAADPGEVAARQFASQTDIHIQSADFLKLRDLSFRFLFPGDWVRPLGLDRGSLTLAGHNLAIWTRYEGADPEINFHGGASTFDRNDSWTIPMTRRLSASLNLHF